MDRTTSIEEIVKLIEEHLEQKIKAGWGLGLEIDNVPLEIREQAVPLWMNKIYSYMRKTLQSACGVALMKGHAVVEEEDMLQALEIHKKGVNRYLPHIPLDK